MYLSQLTIKNFRQFGNEGALHITFQSGVTALVGRNDSGKTAVIDAIRYALLTRDQQYVRVQPEDFYLDRTGKQADNIHISCKFTELDDDEKAAFAEYLSYDGADVSLFVHWAASRLAESPSARRWVDVSVRSGTDGTGPILETSVRELLATAYLRPLRDAEREMSSGRGSRLSQILANVPEMGGGDGFNKDVLPADPSVVERLSLLGLSDYFRHGVTQHKGIAEAEHVINKEYLSSLFLSGENLDGKIDFTEGGTDEARLRQILERLELGLLDASIGASKGQYGLGSNNLLFIACELLLLGREPEGLPLLLIEEPEAHLHPQRQLRLMDFLNRAAAGIVKETKRSVQVILSTHSPNLASKIPLENMVLLDGNHAFPLAEAYTKLDKGDYRFLQRFLDVTKANLFFAHGVIIVEGDAEAILIPVLAELVGIDLTESGISIVNVGGTGLKRYSKIFQRSAGGVPIVSVPVACIADMDVMPDCAPEVLGMVSGDDDEKWSNSSRRWKALRDFGSEDETQDEALSNRRARLKENDGQSVETFIAEHWTLEYDLAICGLAEDVYIAASLAKNDDPLNENKKTQDEVEAAASIAFKALEDEADGNQVLLAVLVYKEFHSGAASKAIAAQYLAERLNKIVGQGTWNPVEYSKQLPEYIVNALVHATTPFEKAATTDKNPTSNG